MCFQEMFNLNNGSFLSGKALLYHLPLPMMYACSIFHLSCHKLIYPQTLWARTF